MSHVVQKYLSLESVPITVDTIHTILPIGWSKLATVITNASILCVTTNITISIRNGILYVSCESSTHIDMFKRIMQTLLQESAKTCMVCGSFGLRRKEQVGSPPLCAQHYIEYINAIEE